MRRSETKCIQAALSREHFFSEQSTVTLGGDELASPKQSRDDCWVFGMLTDFFYILIPSLLLTWVFEAVWKYSGESRAEMHVHQLVFFFLCHDLLIHLGFFCLSGCFGDRWLECTLKVAVISQKADSSEQKTLKIKNHNTSPSTEQSEDCIYTHTNPWKKGYCSFFPFYFL